MTTMEKLRNPRVKIVRKTDGVVLYIRPDDICNGGVHGTTAFGLRAFIEEDELNDQWEIA